MNDGFHGALIDNEEVLKISDKESKALYMKICREYNLGIVSGHPNYVFAVGSRERRDNAERYYNLFLEGRKIGADMGWDMNTMRQLVQMEYISQEACQQITNCTN